MAYTAKQLVAAWTAVHDGLAPDAATLADLQNRAFQNAAGAMTDAQALSFVLNSADNSTALAALSYQFFTGKSPTKDGLAYLVNSDTNPNDLNDAYYGKFNTENRYINFAANLGAVGEGKDAFATNYGAMSFADYIASIYESIIGQAYAKAAGVDPAKAIADIVGRQAALLATAQSAGMITPGMTQAQIDLAVKAAAAGYLMGEAMKADIGLYAAAANNFMLALSQDKAVYDTDLTQTYAPTAGAGSSGTGQPVTAAPPTETVVGYVPPPAPPPPPPAPAAPTPQSFTLTTAADTFAGQGADDTFTGIANLNGSVLTGNMSSTFDPALDDLDGAGGYDTLALTMAGTNSPNLTIDPTRVRNIERLTVTASVANTTVNLATTSGFTELVATPSQSGFKFSGFGASVTKLGLTGLASGAVTFNPNGTALTGAADAVTLTLTDVGTSASSFATVTIGAATPTANEYETLNIVSAVSSGVANYVTLNTDTTQTSLTRLNIGGSAPLTLLFGAGDNIALTPTIDASAATSAVTIGSAASTLGAANQTVKLGSGDDVVYFGANLTSADTVDGGAGYDVLAVSTAVTSAATLTNVSNIEALRFNMGPAGAFTQDASLLAGHGLTELQIDGASLTSLGITNLEIGETVTLTNSPTKTTMSLSLAGGSGGASDSLTLNFASTSASTAVVNVLNNIAGLETLNIVSAGSAVLNRIGSDQLTAKHVITGNTALSITMASAVAGNIDASALTGKLTFTGSTGNDTVVGGIGADTLNAGSGANTITLGAQGQNAQAGADTIVTVGTDTIRFVGNMLTVTGSATTFTGLQAASITGTAGAAVANNPTLRFSADDHDFSLQNAAGTTFTGLARGAVAQGLSAGYAVTVDNVSSADGTRAPNTANVVLFKLTSGAITLSAAGSIEQLFKTAMGASVITGLAPDANYLVSVFESSGTGKTVYAVVNTGANVAGDTSLSADDFTDHGMAVIALVGTTGSNGNGLTLGAAF